MRSDSGFLWFGLFAELPAHGRGPASLCQLPLTFLVCRKPLAMGWLGLSVLPVLCPHPGSGMLRERWGITSSLLS